MPASDELRDFIRRVDDAADAALAVSIAATGASFGASAPATGPVVAAAAAVKVVTAVSKVALDYIDRPEPKEGKTP